MRVRRLIRWENRRCFVERPLDVVTCWVRSVEGRAPVAVDGARLKAAGPAHCALSLLPV